MRTALMQRQARGRLLLASAPHWGLDPCAGNCTCNLKPYRILLKHLAALLVILDVALTPVHGGLLCPQCAGVLAKALKGAWRPWAKAPIGPMVLMGLSDTLVRARKVRTTSVPQSLSGIVLATALGVLEPGVVTHKRHLCPGHCKPRCARLHRALGIRPIHEYRYSWCRLG